MYRTGLLLVSGVVCAAHGELIEYRMWGGATVDYVNVEPLTAGNSAGHVWNGNGPSTEQLGYDLWFRADTDNIVADGLGGFSMAVDSVSYAFGDGSGGVLPLALILRVDAGGTLSFFSIKYNDAWLAIASDVFVGFGLGSDIEPQIHQASAPGSGGGANWWQSATVRPYGVFTTANGRASAVFDEISFSVTRVPSPGAMALLGLGGLIAAHRRR